MSIDRLERLGAIVRPSTLRPFHGPGVSLGRALSGSLVALSEDLGYRAARLLGEEDHGSVLVQGERYVPPSHDVLDRDP